MEEWLILDQPERLLLYGIALLLCLFEKKHHATKGIFYWLSAVLVIGGTGYGLLCGAPLQECAAALTTFLLLIMGETA